MKRLPMRMVRDKNFANARALALKNAEITLQTTPPSSISQHNQVCIRIMFEHEDKKHGLECALSSWNMSNQSIGECIDQIIGFLLNGDCGENGLKELSDEIRRTGRP